MVSNKTSRARSVLFFSFLFKRVDTTYLPVQCRQTESRHERISEKAAISNPLLASFRWKYNRVLWKTDGGARVSLSYLNVALSFSFLPVCMNSSSSQLDIPNIIEKHHKAAVLDPVDTSFSSSFLVRYIAMAPRDRSEGRDVYVYDIEDPYTILGSLILGKGVINTNFYFMIETIILFSSDFEI